MTRGRLARSLKVLLDPAPNRKRPAAGMLVADEGTSAGDALVVVGLGVGAVLVGFGAAIGIAGLTGNKFQVFPGALGDKIQFWPGGRRRHLPSLPLPPISPTGPDPASC